MIEHAPEHADPSTDHRDLALADLATSLADEAARGPMLTAEVAEQDAEALEKMVLHPQYPCLGARSVFTRDRAQIEALGELGTRASARDLLRLLTAFSRDLDVTAGFASLLAVFHGPAITSERHFEQLLWRQLELLHEVDQTPWDVAVSSDPSDPHFAFSVAGRAFFVVGLHPEASRTARRMPRPTLVFNVHEQFEALRRTEKFPRMRDTIRRRDVQLQGTSNPMVADHGSESEARQYSGREVPQEWEPPGRISFAPDAEESR